MPHKKSPCFTLMFVTLLKVKDNNCNCWHGAAFNFQQTARIYCVKINFFNILLIGQSKVFKNTISLSTFPNNTNMQPPKPTLKPTFVDSSSSYYITSKKIHAKFCFVQILFKSYLLQNRISDYAIR